MNFFIILFGKIISLLFRKLHLGNGSTWPGHIALLINKQFIKEILSKSKMKIIIIAGTNGKTTTAKLIRTIFENNGRKVIQNYSGANLLNGIASALLLKSSFSGALNYDYAIFEIDENTLPLILKELKPSYLILLNLFRDQLDRYGEIDSIAKKWKNSLKSLEKDTTLILNTDDPQISSLAEGLKSPIIFFSRENKYLLKSETPADEADSIYCPACSNKLNYNGIYYSHLGDWFCSKCGLRRATNALKSSPYYPLSGQYNAYNTIAAVAVTKDTGLTDKQIILALKNFQPAFGRQEIIKYKNRNIQLFLSKNPTGFNEILRLLAQLKAKTVLLLLNDKTADGHDISWIWDIDVESYLKGIGEIIISGDRLYDLGLRVKYGINNSNYKIIENPKEAIEEGIKNIKASETLYILPTYTAMLQVRKILTGKSIL